MAICKSGWLYFDKSELPAWAKDGEFVRMYRKGNDWVIGYCENPGSGKEYQKWRKHRMSASQMRAGRYEVVYHSPFAVYLRFESESTEKKEPEPNLDENPTGEPPFDPATATAIDARQWLIWREFWLLKMGKVPQGWASAADAFLDRIKERDSVNKTEADKRALTDGSKPLPKTERELLNEIIASPTVSPRDKMQAQMRLNELDAQNGTANDRLYNPEPIIKEI